MAATVHYDVLVIGAGIGGVAAASLLTHAGYRTLLVERLDRVGGRASTEVIDGFRVNTGAAVYEFGKEVEGLCRQVGAPFDIRAVPKMYLRLGRMPVNVVPFMHGLPARITQQVTTGMLKRLPKVAVKHGTSAQEMSVEQWLNRYTKNKWVHAALRSLTCSFFAANLTEFRAHALLTFLGAHSDIDFGFCPEGTIGISRGLVETYQRLGGELWMSSEVRGLHVTNGTVTGATIARDGADVEVRCAAAICDVGPQATVGLVGAQHLPDGYLRRVAQIKPGPMITVNFATRTRLNAKTLTVYDQTKNGRLASVVHFTDTCPEMAPEGWHLYLGWGVPVPALTDFDTEAETDLILDDLRDKLPGFDDARILSIAVLRDAWPAQRAVSGYAAPYTTPLANLWNVGDGVMEHGAYGMEGVVKVVKNVVAEVAQQRHTPESATTAPD